MGRAGADEPVARIVRDQALADGGADHALDSDDTHFAHLGHPSAGLDAGQVGHVLGLTATRAAGLKAQFDTMGKPYNAGLAAESGVGWHNWWREDFKLTHRRCRAITGLARRITARRMLMPRWRDWVKIGCLRLSATSFTPVAMGCTGT